MKKYFNSVLRVSLVLVMAVLLLSGCSYIRREVVAVGQWDVNNAAATKQVAQDFLLTWPLNSGFIRASLGENIDKLPHSAVKAMDDLDALAAKTNLTDAELGASLGLRVRMLASLVSTTLQEYFPQFLKDVPSLVQLLF